jgi:uncharacterized membrane protein
VTLHTNADSTAADTGYANLSVAAKPENQDSVLAATSDVSLTLVQAIPVISTSPSYIDTGIVKGNQKLASFTITNAGAASLTNARIEGPSTSWMSLSADPIIGDIAVGDSRSIGIYFKPDAGIAQGLYDDQIVIYSDNHIPYTYHIRATITSNATGNAFFDVMNQ